MATAVTSTAHLLRVDELTAEAFAPYGEVVKPARAGGQGISAQHPVNPKLVLSSERPRLWVMQLPHVGIFFQNRAPSPSRNASAPSRAGVVHQRGAAGDLPDDAAADRRHRRVPDSSPDI